MAISNAGLWQRVFKVVVCVLGAVQLQYLSRPLHFALTVYLSFL